MIGLEFEDSRDVLEAWKEYLDFLNRTEPEAEVAKQQFYKERDGKFTDLIFALSRKLRYTFTRLEIEKLTYTPIAHGTWAEQDTILRQGATKLFTGEYALPVQLISGQATKPEGTN